MKQEEIFPYESQMETLIYLLYEAKEKLRLEIKNRRIKNLKVKTSYENGQGRQGACNDRRMYFWIETEFEGEEYDVNLFKSEIDPCSGNCHCQIGRIMFSKGFVINKNAPTSPNEILKDKNGDWLTNNKTTVIKFNSYKWEEPFAYFVDKNKERLANKKWVTIDDVLRKKDLTKEIVDAFLKFIGAYKSTNEVCIREN